MTVLIGEQETKISKLLPHVAWHFVEERVFAVDDLVVGEGQHEILGEGVDKGEGNFVVLVFAIDGIRREVFKGVVHPAHIPFETEAETAEIGGAGDTGPRGRFFGDGEYAGEATVG